MRGADLPPELPEMKVRRPASTMSLLLACILAVMPESFAGGAPATTPAPEGTGSSAPMPPVPPALPDERPDARTIATLLRQLKQTRDPDRAEILRKRLLMAWLAAGSASARALLQQAARAQADGLTELAERLLNLVVKRWPDYEEGRLRRAFLRWQLGRREAALADLDAILARNPDHFPSLVLKVRILGDAERLKEAVRACRQLLERFPHWREMRHRCQRLQLRLEREA